MQFWLKPMLHKDKKIAIFFKFRWAGREKKSGQGFSLTVFQCHYFEFLRILTLLKTISQVNFVYHFNFLAFIKDQQYHSYMTLLRLLHWRLQFGATICIFQERKRKLSLLENFSAKVKLHNITKQWQCNKSIELVCLSCTPFQKTISGS